MTPEQFVATVALPARDWMIQVLGQTPLWTPTNTERALIMLTVIPMVEVTEMFSSGREVRVQDGGGPAHSFWQFEGGKGELLDGVLRDSATRAWATKLCAAAGVAPVRYDVWSLFASSRGDNLAFGISRGAVYLIADPLPDVGDKDGAYQQYLGQWRPGAPSYSRWSTAYPQAVAAVRAALANTAQPNTAQSPGATA